MQNSKKTLVKTIKLGFKVGYLFITRNFVSKEEIAKSYDRVSQTYQERYLKTMHIYNDQLLQHFATLINHGKVLDLAGGTGYNSSYLQKFGDYEIDLVDLSQEMLKHCRIQKVNCINEGMLAYLKKQPNNCYNAVFCTWALLYEQPIKVLQECYRVLKQSGYLYILVNDKETLPQIRKVYPKLLIRYVDTIKRLMLELPMPKHTVQLNKWMQRVGFKVICSEALEQNFNFDSWLEAVDFVCGTGALAGYDVMIDLHDQDIKKSLVEELTAFSSRPQITHHFTKGVFYKGGK